MPDLNTLFIFAHVAESRNFSAAARRLKMPLSTVSRRIAELEGQFGADLLYRSTRSLRLTPLGEQIYGLSRRIVDIDAVVQDVLARHNQELAGSVRFAAPPNLSDTILTPLIVRFQARYPDVRFEVMVSEQIIDYVDDRIDFEVHVGPVPKETLVVRRVLRFRHRLVASPTYLQHHSEPGEPAELSAHQIVAFSHSEQELVWAFEHVGGDRRERIKLKPSLAINDYASVIEMLLAGRGIGDLPPIIRPDLVRDGRLVPVMPDWRFPMYDLALVSPLERFQTHVVSLFKDFVSAELPKLFPEHALR